MSKVLAGLELMVAAPAVEPVWCPLTLVRPLGGLVELVIIPLVAGETGEGLVGFLIHSGPKWRDAVDVIFSENSGVDSSALIVRAGVVQVKCASKTLFSR